MNNGTFAFFCCMIVFFVSGLVIGFTGVGIYVHNNKQFSNPIETECTIVETTVIPEICHEKHNAEAAKSCYAIKWNVTYETDTKGVIIQKGFSLESATHKQLDWPTGSTHKCWYDKDNTKTIRWYCTCTKHIGIILLSTGWGMFGFCIIVFLISICIS